MNTKYKISFRKITSNNLLSRDTLLFFFDTIEVYAKSIRVAATTFNTKTSQIFRMNKLLDDPINY